MIEFIFTTQWSTKHLADFLNGLNGDWGHEIPTLLLQLLSHDPSRHVTEWWFDQAIENNLHIRQQLFGVYKSFVTFSQTLSTVSWHLFSKTIFQTGLGMLYIVGNIFLYGISFKIIYNELAIKTRTILNASFFYWVQDKISIFLTLIMLGFLENAKICEI